MAKSTRPPVSIQRRLEERVAALETDLAALREQLATEVRTKRLAVVNEQGHELITATAGVYASLEVFSPVDDEDGEKHPDRVKAVRIQADAETAAVMLSGGGNVIADLTLRDADAGPVGCGADRPYWAGLTISRPDGVAGIDLNHEGLHLARERLHDESARAALDDRAQAIERKARAALAASGDMVAALAVGLAGLADRLEGLDPQRAAS